MARQPPARARVRRTRDRQEHAGGGAPRGGARRPRHPRPLRRAARVRARPTSRCWTGSAAMADDAEVAATIAARAPSWLPHIPWLATSAADEAARGATRERMLREIVETLEALAAARPVILFIEDLQWADPSTRDLLGALMRRRHPARVLVVATGSEPDPLVVELSLRGTAQELALGPLDPAAAAAAFGVDADMAAELVRRAGGNPLFMRHLVEHLRTTGSLDGMPETLRAALLARLAQHEEADLEVLQAGALAGHAVHGRGGVGGARPSGRHGRRPLGRGAPGDRGVARWHADGGLRLRPRLVPRRGARDDPARASRRAPPSPRGASRGGLRRLARDRAGGRDALPLRRPPRARRAVPPAGRGPVRCPPRLPRGHRTPPPGARRRDRAAPRPPAPAHGDRAALGPRAGARRDRRVVVARGAFLPRACARGGGVAGRSRAAHLGVARARDAA